MEEKYEEMCNVNFQNPEAVFQSFSVFAKRVEKLTVPVFHLCFVI